MTDDIKTPEPKPAAPRSRKPAAEARPEAADIFSLGKFDMTKFDMSKLELPEAFREGAEKSVRQARDAYERFRVATEEATRSIETQLETTRSGVATLNAKAIEGARANLDASFTFARDMLAVKTFAEVIELQTAFARSQIELATRGAREFQELATDVAASTAAPAKDAFERFMKTVSAA